MGVAYNQGKQCFMLMIGFHVLLLSTFRVENEAKLFRLEVAGYRGNATSKLINHNGMPFTTYDEDNDNNDE